MKDFVGKSLSWKQIILITIIGLLILLIPSSTRIDKQCYKDRAILHKQWVGNLKGCCENCLIFNVTEFVCKDGCGCEWKDRLLYFAHEQELRFDLEDGDEILIRWCWDKSAEDYFIRGVFKIN